MIPKNLQLYKFSAYGFLKNLRFFAPFIILFFREQEISFLQIGVLFSVREIATSFLEIPTGIVADTFGRKSSMIFSFVSYIISFLIFYLFPNYFFYIIAMLFFALGEAFRTGTHKALILEYLKINKIEHMKIEYYGYTRSWSQIGSGLAALIAGAIVFFSGNYKYIFVSSTIPYILALFLMISYPDYLNGEIRKKEHPNLFKAVYLNFMETLLNFIKIFKNPVLLKSLFNSSLFDGLFKAVKDYLQPILKGFALTLPIFLFLKDKRDTIVIALVYFILYLLTSYASRNSGRFVKTCRSLASAINRTYISGMILIFLSGLFLILNLKVITIILFILLFILQNLRRPMNVGFVSEIIPSKVMASGLSAESQLKTFIIAVLSPIMGLLADKLGIAAGLIILSVFILFLFPLVRLNSDNAVEV
jgi:MFS family permease